MSTTRTSPTSGRRSRSPTGSPAGSPTVEGDLRIGGTVQARFTSSWEGPGRIDVCDAPNRLLLTMEPGTDDEAEIEAVAHRRGRADAARRRGTRTATRGPPRHGAGWQAHIEDLGRYLAGGQSNWQARWTELIPAYRSLDLCLTGSAPPFGERGRRACLRLRDARFERGAECFAHRLELDAVEHVLEEPAHDQPFGFGP